MRTVFFALSFSLQALLLLSDHLLVTHTHITPLLLLRNSLFLPLHLRWPNSDSYPTGKPYGFSDRYRLSGSDDCRDVTSSTYGGYSGATATKENSYYAGDKKCYTYQTCKQAGKKTCNGCLGYVRPALQL